MGGLSCIFTILIYCIVKKYAPELFQINGFWTLAILIISAPVAFIIWHFRDQNVSHQIENQRKDINLKEFQKLAEWVSGINLIEDKFIEKEKDEKGIIERSREYIRPSQDRSIYTISKTDSAIALQVSAIYSLLPFYRGDYGDSFRTSSLNLLLSLWKILQNDELSKLISLRNELVNLVNQTESHNDNKNILDNYQSVIYNLKEKAHSPIGIAITQVLLSDGGTNLIKFPEVFPGLCLAGMDFKLPGLKPEVLDIFSCIDDCSNINLQGANLVGAKFKGKFIFSDLSGANLTDVNILEKSDFEFSFFTKSELTNVNIKDSNFNDSYILYSILSGKVLSSSFKNSFLIGNNMDDLDVFYSDFSGGIFEGSLLSGCSFKYTDLRKVSFGYDRFQNSEYINLFDFPKSFYGSIINYDNSLELERADKEIKIKLSKDGLIYLFYDNTNFSYVPRQKISLKNDNECHNYVVEIERVLDVEKIKNNNPSWKIEIQ
ncbi:pentapeptide repeat-containing protein [Aggregatibacter aphrophilus]|nr:pentapeptide repeat-containing protein [Aggregatibacter aphrophilus]